MAELDLVIGSVHSYMNLEAAEMTDRLMRALESPHLRVLGHPTGRVLLHREPFPFDFDAVAAEAARRNVYLEINASPERLDLGSTLVRAARAKRLQVRDLHRCPPSQTSGEHELRRAHGAPRLARSERYSEYSARGRICAGDPAPMKLISSTELNRTPIFTVTLDRAVDPDGFEIKRAIVQHGGSAVIMPVDDRGRILLVRQYRLPARQFLWELPAGRVDEGETPRAAARRELI